MPDVISRQKEAERGITLCGFLGGITITALVLLMQSSETFSYGPLAKFISYPELLTDGMGILVVLFIMSTMGFVKSVTSIEGGNKGEVSMKRSDKSLNLAYKLQSGGFYGICILIPMLLLPLSLVGSVVVAAIAAISNVLYSRIR